LIVALAAGCSFDASRLQGAVSRAADGAVEYPVVPDTTPAEADGVGITGAADAVLGGNGGSAGQADSGGSTSADATMVLPDLAGANEVAFPAEVSPMPDAEADVPAVADAPVLADDGPSATGGSSQSSDTTATGGTTGSGGDTSFGGATATGGDTNLGGATGGATATGGDTNLGGTTATGGDTSSGGTTATGGVAPGGTTAIGGTTSLGGATASGGAPNSGGSIGTVTTTCPGAVPAGIASSWCSCTLQGNSTSGALTYTNNIWGTGAGAQCMWTTTTSKWGVAANHPNTLNIKSFPNVSLSPQTAINAINSYTSSFDVTVPSSGSWATAYNLWIKGNMPGRTQISLWMNQNGAMQPTSTVAGGPTPVPDQTSVRLGGHVWDVYFGNSITFVRTTDTNSGSVDILAILRWIIANYNTGRGGINYNWTLDQVQFGFDITSDGSTQAFVTNSFSVTST
jgi:hypothetical protein